MTNPQLKVFEQLIWILSNITHGSRMVAERVVCEAKTFRIIAQVLRNLPEISIHVMQLIEYLCYAVSTIEVWKKDWYMEFVDFINVLSKIFLSYTIENPTEENRLLWFIDTYMDSDDKAIEIIMDHLEIASVIIEYLNSDSFSSFRVAIKLAGTIISGSNSEYAENLLKNGLLESIIVGWNKFDEKIPGTYMVAVNKEIAWTMSNLIA